MRESDQVQACLVSEACDSFYTTSLDWNWFGNTQITGIFILSKSILFMVFIAMSFLLWLDLESLKTSSIYPKQSKASNGEIQISQ